MQLTLDANLILNSLTLAGVLWILASITGLRERVSRIEGVLSLNKRKADCNVQT